MLTLNATETVAGAILVESESEPLPNTGAAVLLAALKALPEVLWVLAKDGATALTVRMVAKPRLTAVVVTSATDFFNGFRFR